MAVAAKSFVEKLACYKKTLVLSFLFFLITLIIVQDLIEASVNNFSFYFSESFLFSSFWWLFIPLGYIQYKFCNSNFKNKLTYCYLAVIVPVVFHLIAFPLLVQLLSSLFLDHTFAFRQTWYYTLSEHLYQLILVYTVPLAVFLVYRSKELPQKGETTFPALESAAKENSPVSALAITDNNRHFNIALAEVIYFTASTPYVTVFDGQKKYLITDTLKALTEKLPAGDFVRIHKSSIVNINRVTQFTSRLNGDYDITMDNGTVLRVSRNYARDFKERFNQSHPVTSK